MKKIPGWNLLTEEERESFLSDPFGDADMQEVDGHWYVPESSTSLQTLVNEWLEALMTIWLDDRFENSSGWQSVTSTGEDVKDILTNWGWLDEKGQPTEKAGQGWVKED